MINSGYPTINFTIFQFYSKKIILSVISTGKYCSEVAAKGSYFLKREQVLSECSNECPSHLGTHDYVKIGHVRYINILTWLRGFQVKLLYLVLFSLYLSLFWELRDKRNLKNLHF